MVHAISFAALSQQITLSLPVIVVHHINRVFGQQNQLTLDEKVMHLSRIASINVPTIAAWVKRPAPLSPSPVVKESPNRIIGACSKWSPMFLEALPRHRFFFLIPLV